MRAAIVLTLLCAGLGVLAPYVPNFWVGFRFAWLAVCYLVGTASLSTGHRTFLVGIALGLIAGAGLGYVYSLSMTYDQERDLMLIRPWSDGLLFPIMGILGGMLSLIPSYHAYRVEKRLKGDKDSGQIQRIAAGARTGLKQSALITLIFSPLLFFVAKGPAVSRSPSRVIPPEILQGPSFQGHLSFFISLVLMLIIAGTLSGAITGLLYDIQRKGETP